MTSTKAAPGPGYNLMVEQHLRFAEAIVQGERGSEDADQSICPWCGAYNGIRHDDDCIVHEARAVVEQARGAANQDEDKR